MSFKYETQGVNTYIVYEIDNSEMLDSMTLGMITNNKIAGLAQAFFFQQDNTKYVKYNVSSKVSAEQFLMGTVNKKRLIGVFKGIVNALISAEEYMIDASSLCFDLDYIYTDVTSCETVMLCLPITDAEKPLIDLKAFFKNIVFSVQFDQTENGDYIAKLINYLNSASAFSLYDFKDVLDVIEHSSKPVQESVQTPVQQTQSQASASQNVTQATGQPSVTPVQPQSVVSPVAPRPTAVPQQAVAPNTGFAVPEKDMTKMSAEKKMESTSTTASEEKEISWFYLMQHYNKENAALYKAQQEVKKAAKTAEKQDKKKDKKKAKETIQNSVPTPGFAIPGQTPQSVSQSVTSAYVAPEPRVTAVPQPAYQQSVQMTPVQPSTQSVQAAPVMSHVSQISQKPVNFGETTVLNVGIGETTVLGASSVAIEINPYLIRVKNNERIMVDKPVFRIGKEKSFVDYFIGDNTAISRSHANIITRGGEYFVQDTNSTNHTYVDGQMIQSNVEVKIAHGTKIKLANEDFEFRIY